MTSPAGAPAPPFRTTKTFTLILIALGFASVLSLFAAIPDVTDGSADLPRLAVVWGLLTAVLATCLIATIGSLRKTELSQLETLFGVFTAACVFFVALYASTMSWPSQNLGPALVVTTLALGTSTIFLRFLVRDAARAEGAATYALLRDSLTHEEVAQKIATKIIAQLRAIAESPAPRSARDIPENLPLAQRARIAWKLLRDDACLV